MLSGAATTPAQLSPNGDQFQVNSYTTSYQTRSTAATDDQGNFVVVWSSDGSNGTDISDSSIQAQRFAPDGTALGGQFQVNTYTTDFQGYPAVEADRQGGFLIAWVSLGSNGTDTGPDNPSIQAQRYDVDGGVLGGEFQVNSYTTGGQTYPAMAFDDLHRFVVAWISSGSSGTDTSGASIQAQRYDASGARLGEEFQVNSYTTGNQFTPAVAMNAQGGFIIAWHSFGSAGTDTEETSIQAQRFDSGGAPLGEQIQVNTYTTSLQYAPVVAVADQGNFVVAWGSDGSDGTDASYSSSQAQLFDANGDPVGGQFQVNTFTLGLQHGARLAMNRRGEFVINWSSTGSSGTDSDSFSIQAQRYDATGAAMGGEFQVNSYTTGQQNGSDVAIDSRGNFVIVWNSSGSTGSDTGSGSIQAQRYDGLFRDDFEIGDMSRWSASVP
ncbi:MAG: hypothetical protein ABI689_10725 [Thermoanaerobaculia bacterium]